MQNYIFRIIIQASVSYDYSEIIIIWWFSAQETSFLIIINVENSFKS